MAESDNSRDGESPVSAGTANAEPPAAPIPLQDKPNPVSEVEIGGENFRVRVVSSAALGEVLAAAERLYQLRPGTERPGSGFSLQGSDVRGAVEYPLRHPTSGPAHYEVG